MEIPLIQVSGRQEALAMSAEDKPPKYYPRNYRNILRAFPRKDLLQKIKGQILLNELLKSFPGTS